MVFNVLVVLELGEVLSSQKKDLVTTLDSHYLLLHQLPLKLLVKKVTSSVKSKIGTQPILMLLKSLLPTVMSVTMVLVLKLNLKRLLKV